MNKRNTALLALFTDLAVSIWSYFQLSNYSEYVKTVKPYLDSPDFQLQIYQVLVQSLTFSLLLFLIFHLAIYWQYNKSKKWAILYVRVYTLLAALLSIILVFSQVWAGIIPLLIYSWLFLCAKKAVQELKG